MTTVKFEHVTKKYGDRAAVNDASVHLDDATWCVIVGPNGSGKTTLLALAAGLAQPTSGTVEIGSVAAGAPLARAEVSYLSDSPAFYSDLTVAEHVDYLAGLYDDESVADRAVRFVDAFGLGERADDLPETFSRGMKQKTALALALARPASVFLLDEPTRGLDVAGADTLVNLIAEFHRDGATIITVTHEPERFAGIAGTRLEVNEGTVRQHESQ
jgi:ABC-type multidrug transport system ATPase subunit